MKKNLFDMGANFEDEWSSNNKSKPNSKKSNVTKAPNRHQLHFAKEKRRDKIVTIVKPFYIEKKEFNDLLKTIKKLLGAGGTIKENHMEFQGEVTQKLKVILENLDFGLKK